MTDPPQTQCCGFVDNITIDGQRQCTTEVRVADQFALFLIRIVVSEQDALQRTDGLQREGQLDARAFGGIHIERHVENSTDAAVEVDFPGQYPKLDLLGIGFVHQVAGDIIDIGELVPFSVDRPVVGIALHFEQHVFLVANRTPRIEDRNIGGIDAESFGRCHVHAVEQLAECLLWVAIDLGVAGVELAPIVLGAEREALLAVRETTCEEQETGVRLVELDANGEIVDLDDLVAFGVVTGNRQRLLVELGMDDVIPPEHDVIGSKQFAIRPTDALTHVERDGGKVVIPLERLSQIGNEAFAVRGDAGKTDLRK